MNIVVNSTMACVLGVTLASCHHREAEGPWEVKWQDGDTALQAGPYDSRREALNDVGRMCPHRYEVLDVDAEDGGSKAVAIHTGYTTVVRSRHRTDVYVTFRCWSK